MTDKKSSDSTEADNTTNNGKVNQETREPASAEKYPSSQKPTQYTAKKYTYGALTWLFCTFLLIPSYLDTGIIAIALLIPFSLVMTIGTWLEGRKLRVLVNENEIEFVNRQGFNFKKDKIPYSEITGINTEVTVENKEETINFIEIKTQKGTTILPDIDQREALLNELRIRVPQVPMEKSAEPTSEQQKKYNTMLYFSAAVAVIGFILNIILISASEETGLLLRGLKGGFVGFILGTILWFIGFNISEAFKKG